MWWCMYIHSQILSIYKHGITLLNRTFEVCAIRLSYRSVNLCVLSAYRSLSVNLDTFIVKLEEISNILFQNQVNLVMWRLNVNFGHDIILQDGHLL
jgi:hypothetical protein